MGLGLVLVRLRFLFFLISFLSLRHGDPPVCSLDSPFWRGQRAIEFYFSGAGNRHARFDERGWETERCRPSNRAHPRFYHFRRFDVASYSASDRLIEGSPKNSTSTVPIMPWGASDQVQRCADFVEQ
jgi:hypothetical protein